MSDPDNGSSNTVSPDRDENTLRAGNDFLPREPGVVTDAYEGEELADPSKEGIISLESVRVDTTDSAPVSLPAVSSSSTSSGGLSRKSSGPFPNDMLNSFSDTDVSSRIESTVSLCLAPRDFRRLLLFDFGGGIAVIARSAATEGGMASGEWVSRVRRSA